MALVPCPECGKNVSTRASACPHCGCPLESVPAGAGTQAAEADLSHNRAVAPRDGERYVNALGIEFVLVPKGAFWMGGGNGTCGNQQVTIDRDFYLGVYPVTQ